jgi:hypothetical protein
MPSVACELLIMRDESYFAHLIINQNNDEYIERYYDEFVDREYIINDDSKFNDNNEYLSEDPTINFDDEPPNQYEMIQDEWEPDYDYDKFGVCDDNNDSYLDKFTRSKYD